MGQLLLVVFSSFTFANIDYDQNSICGSDDRVFSDVAQVGRLRGEKHCSGSLFSNKCFITAGHCVTARTHDYVEFNVPKSIDGELTDSDPIDTYSVTQSTIVFRDSGASNDWAVMQLEPNDLSGRWPGDVQGHYEISFRPVRSGITVRVTGYGRDSNRIATGSQQTHAAELKSSGRVLSYAVDTMGGNSGSSIIDELTQEIIGVHSYGNCGGFFGRYNQGTAIAANAELQSAIRACLEN